MSDGLSQQAAQAPVGAGQGGSSAGTFRVSESDVRADVPVMVAVLADARVRADQPAMTGTLSDLRARADSLSVPSAASRASDSAARADQAKFVVSWTASARSGTPDSDAWGDAWTDASVGQTGVNHGNDASLGVNGVAGSTRNAFLEIDLTRFSGLTANGTHSFGITSDNGALTAANYTLAIYQQPARWFTESTITQSNEPNPGSPILTATFSDPASSGRVRHTVTINDSQMQSLLGKWVLVKVTGDLTTAASVKSREDSDKPALSFSTLI